MYDLIILLVLVAAAGFAIGNLAIGLHCILADLLITADINADDCELLNVESMYHAFTARRHLDAGQALYEESCKISRIEPWREQVDGTPLTPAA